MDLGQLEKDRQRQERDPHGKNAHEPGAKMDEHKYSFLRAIQEFPAALDAVSRIGDYGAAKYSERGWMSVPDGPKRYTEALLRHVSSDGVYPYDVESAMLHAAHAAWNALARLELILTESDLTVVNEWKHR